MSVEDASLADCAGGETVSPAPALGSSRKPWQPSAGRATGWLLAGMILVGAFLLFQVQPLICRFILPWFGGSPAVWTTCMLFFQTLLFGGYVYAHLSQRFLSVRGQALLQLSVIVAALVLLPIAPAAGWKPSDSSDPTWRILLLLTATVGLPYFVLSGTSPLVQTWFSRRYPGRSPYRLYALSNVGSLAALLSYPFVFEPAFDLETQSWWWSALFVIYAVLAAVSAAALWPLSERPAVAANLAPDARSTAPTWPMRGLWLILPAIASLMLLATTNHVCQDVAVVPFLWVVPLALYLLSFIICFDHSRWYVRPFWASLAIAGILLSAGISQVSGLLADWFHYDLTFVGELVIHFTALLAICMVCHGELVRRQPDARHLTEYYLWISAGGALGGIAVSLVAPLVFRSFAEWQIGQFLGLSVAFVAMARALSGRARGAESTLLRNLRLGAFSAAAVVLAAATLYLQTDPGDFTSLFAYRPRLTKLIDQQRNFYGVVSVREYGPDSVGDHIMMLRHGTTTHGRQFLDSAWRTKPNTYYGETSGVGQLMALAQRKPKIRVGVVGLGAGTLAAYGRPDDDFVFYEINPQVEAMAREHFSYLADCRANCEVVMGDARLSLEGEPPRHFDLLVLDAFSGDSIPTHLLTDEALAIYQKHLDEQGAIAIHITNHYVDLSPVVRGLAARGQLQVARLYRPYDQSTWSFRNDWMILSRNADWIAALGKAPGAISQTGQPIVVWTDHASDLFSLLRAEGAPH